MKAGRAPEVLLVEDDDGDVELTRHSFRQLEAEVRLHVVRDGVEALLYLRRQPPFGDATRPDLVLLDLNLPRKNGREVLAEVKRDPDLRCIPVIVLTTSEADEDVHRCYEMGANCYIPKPLDLARFREVTRALRELWFVSARLPSRL